VARSHPSWGSVPKMRRVRYSTPGGIAPKVVGFGYSQPRHGRPQATTCSSVKRRG
jgi:hypothetical protein